MRCIFFGLFIDMSEAFFAHIKKGKSSIVHPFCKYLLSVPKVL